MRNVKLKCERLNKIKEFNNSVVAQSAEAVEYTDCTSPER